MSDRHVKILATVGPACQSQEALLAMIEAGASAFRLNASHGDPQKLKMWIPLIRKCEEISGKPIAILLDLPGPKLRVGELPAEGVELIDGTSVTLVPEGFPDGIPAGDWELLHQVKPGEPILLIDGRIHLETSKVEPNRIIAKVISGGRLFTKKGINLPGTQFDLPDLLPQDHAALEAVGADVDWVALSFVREPHAASSLRFALSELGSSAWVMAKIERPEAMKFIVPIVHAFDGIMVARGDLGVELPLEQVPRLQRQALTIALSNGKVAVTATEMLESMIHEQRPTRAEASDVAAAVWQHTDAVMLSAETAVGAHPAHTIATMARIISEAEREVETEILLRRRGGASETEEAIARGSAWMALDLQAKAIITPTTSGMTARRVARFRPRNPIIATSRHVEVLRKLSLVSGVISVPIEWSDHPIDISLDAVRGKFGLSEGDTVVVTGGWPPDQPGRTNFVQVRTL